MASKYAVEAIFKIIDQATPKLDKIGVKGNVVGKALKKDFLSAQDTIANLGKAALKAGAMIGAAALAAGTAFVAKGVKDAVEYEKAMERIGVQAGLTADQVKAFSKDLLNLSDSTGTSVQTLAEAQLEAISAGVSAADSVKFVEVAVKAANGGFTDTSTVINSLSSVLKSYSLEASEAGRVSDQMMAAAKAGGIPFEDMATKIEKVLPVAARFGVSTEELFSAIATLTSQGVPIADATKKIKSALEKDGKQGIFDITSAEKFRDILSGVQNSTGTTQTAFERMDQTTEEKFGSLGNKIKNIGIRIGTALLPVIDKIIQRVDVFIQNFSNMDFDAVAGKIGNVLNIIFGGIELLIKMIGFLWKMRSIIIGIAAAWGIYKAAMLAAVVVSKVMAMVKVVQGLMAAQKGMNVVQAIFNALLTANPIGLIIMAIGILIGLVILAVTHWDDICAALSRAWEWIKKVATIIWDGIVNAFKAMADWIGKNIEKVTALLVFFTGPFGFIISIVKELKDNWSAVVETFKTEGIIAGLKKLGGVILSAILAPIQGFLELLANIPLIGDKIKPAIGKIEEFRNTLKGVESVTAEVSTVTPEAVNTAAGAVTSTTTSGVAAVSPGVQPSTVQPTSPITQAQQQSYYSRSESRETVDINVRPESGTAASVSRQARSPNVRVTASGDN